MGTRLAISFSIALAGCSLLLDTSERTQCASNADCDADPRFRNLGRVCELGFCAKKAPTPRPVSSEGEACTSTDICTRNNSGRASKCLVEGQPCVPWQIEGCPTVTGDWRNPNAVMIGALLPFNFRQVTGASRPVSYTRRLQDAIDLAVYDFEEKNPIGFQIGPRSSPLAVLFCDSQGNSEIAKSHFNHLTEVVGAKAVIVGWDNDLAAIAVEATQRKTTIVCSDCLAPFPPGPTAWRIIPPITLDAPLASWRVADLEAKIKVADPAPIKVTILTEGVTVSNAFSEELRKTLRFNGKSQSSPSNELQLIAIEDPRKGIVPHADHGKEIADFAPDIIVAGMASALPEYMMRLIEEAWPQNKRRPFYVGTQLNYEVAPFDTLFLENDDLRRRFSGTFPRISDERRASMASFEARYRAAMKFDADGTFSGYEALYATAFALAAAGKNAPFAELDGPFISSGFKYLTSGPTVDFNPASIPSGLSLFTSNPSINVRGLTTDLDWDLDTRDFAVDMGMYCFGRNGDALELKTDPGGVYYSAVTKQVTGTYACE